MALHANARGRHNRVAAQSQFRIVDFARQCGLERLDRRRGAGGSDGLVKAQAVDCDEELLSSALSLGGLQILQPWPK